MSPILFQIISLDFKINKMVDDNEPYANIVDVFVEIQLGLPILCSNDED